FVAGAGPGFAGRRIAEMVAHAGGARREDREICSALALQFELAVRDRVADLVVGYRRARRRRPARRGRLDLLAPPAPWPARRGRVVAVAIDDHGTSPLPARTVIARCGNGRTTGGGGGCPAE